MQAVVQTRTGGPEVLEAQERPEPELGDRDVRIAVRAAGLNFADIMARAGLYPPARSRPACSATRCRAWSRRSGRPSLACEVGQRVMAGTKFGGKAEIVVVPEETSCRCRIG